MLPEYGHLQISQTLRDVAIGIAYLGQSSSLFEAIALTRCSSTKMVGESYQSYVYSGNDPTIQFHLRSGAQIVSIVDQYRPEDFLNIGNAVLVSYKPHTIKDINKKRSTVKQVGLDDILNTLNSVVKVDKMDPSTPDKPFMDFGLDSLQLMELRSSLEAITGLSLSTTALFDYPTPKRLLASIDVSSVNHLSDIVQKDETTIISNPNPSIAICGMSCRFPGEGVYDPETFYEFLCQSDGHNNAIKELPPG